MQNPITLSAAQTKPSSDLDSALRRALGLNVTKEFRNLPRSERYDIILDAVVPSKKNPTHEKVLAIVDALIKAKAIRKDEGGQIYNAILQRVSRYNSLNVQTNLDRLVSDIKEASIQHSINNQQSLGSLITLNSFLSTLPANVQRGQDDYIAFLGALKTMILEIPQSEVYQSGPHFFFQTSRNGYQTVNLTNAFENLKDLWGVKNQTITNPSASSMLTPNTRLLLLLIAPFTDKFSISRTSYIGHLLTLYREAIGQNHIDEQTYNEITNISKSMGNENADQLQATLNFLLTDKKKKFQPTFELTPEEDRILRYVQLATAHYLINEGVTPSMALDKVSANFEPSFYAHNRVFINKLMDYLHRAAALSPKYLEQIIFNKYWTPPSGFFNDVFEFPEDTYTWDEMPSSNRIEDDRISLSELGAAAPAETSKSLSLSFLDDYPTPNISRAPSLEYLDNFFTTEKSNNVSSNGIDDLVDKVAKWKTYRQEQEESLEGTGINPFAHLKPKGLY